MMLLKKYCIIGMIVFIYAQIDAENTASMLNNAVLITKVLIDSSLANTKKLAVNAAPVVPVESDLNTVLSKALLVTNALVVNNAASNIKKNIRKKKSLTPPANVTPPSSLNPFFQIQNNGFVSDQNPMFSLTFNAQNLQMSDILWINGTGFVQGNQFTTSAPVDLSGTNIFPADISTIANQGLVCMSVSVSDGSDTYLQFNFNPALFNTMNIQQLLQQGMYVAVFKMMQNNVPMVVVQLLDESKKVYAQGMAPACANPAMPTVNFNPTTYMVGLNTYNPLLQSTLVNQLSIGPVPIDQVVTYQQVNFTPAKNYLNLPVISDDKNIPSGYTGNLNIGNITPVIIASENGFPAGYNISGQNFANSITEITSSTLQSAEPISCVNNLRLVNVGIYDGVDSYIVFNFTVDNMPLLRVLSELGLFITVDLFAQGQPNGPAVYVYLTDVNGTIYAQGSQSLPSSATPTSYSVGFNTTNNAYQDGLASIGIDAVPFNKVVWYEQKMNFGSHSQTDTKTKTLPAFQTNVTPYIVPSGQNSIWCSSGSCNFSGTPVAVQASIDNPYTGSYIYGIESWPKGSSRGSGPTVVDLFPLTNINCAFTDGTNGYFSINFDKTALSNGNLPILFAPGGQGAYLLIDITPTGSNNQATLTVSLTDPQGNVQAQATQTISGQITSANIGFNMTDTLQIPGSYYEGFINNFNVSSGNAIFIQNLSGQPTKNPKNIISNVKNSVNTNTTIKSQPNNTVPVTVKQIVSKVKKSKRSNTTVVVPKVVPPTKPVIKSKVIQPSVYQVPAAQMQCSSGSCIFVGVPAAVQSSIDKPYMGSLYYGFNQMATAGINAQDIMTATVVNLFPLTNINCAFTDGLNGYFSINFDQTALSQGTLPTLLAKGGQGAYLLIDITPTGSNNQATLTVSLADPQGNVQAQATQLITGQISTANIGFNMTDTLVPPSAANQGYINNYLVLSGQAIFIQNS